MEIQAQRRQMVGPTARLVEFLRDLARTGRPRRQSIAEYPVSRWLVDLPAEVTLTTEAEAGDTLFSIDPVVSEPPPEPPPEVARCLDPAALARIGDSTVERIELSFDLPDMPQADLSEVLAAYESWMQRWQLWADADRRLSPRRSWYEELARVARHLEQQDDIYELVIGTGLVTWNSQAGLIHHPLLTTRAEVITRPGSGRLDLVVPEGATTRIGDRALLDGLPEFEPQRSEAIRDEVRSGPAVPLGDHNKDLLSRWRSLALSRAYPYDHAWEPTEGAGRPDEVGVSGPDVRFAPVLILRHRDRTSLIDYYDRMLEALSGPDALAPLGLAQLLSALEPEDRLAWLADEGADDGNVVGSDPLFPLPTNPEQRQVMDRLRHDNGVVVLGPPGTGKTHTIANLLSALLARGQRVLVTSQKAQALRVLREQLPPEIQKLCVSMTDVARGGSQELNQSVTALSDRYSSFSEPAHRQQVRARGAARDAARQEVAELKERIRELRASETEVHPPVAAGYQGTKARIAERLAQHAAASDWMPVPVPAAAPFDPPLTVSELAELRRLLASATPERRARAHQVLPELGSRQPAPPRIQRPDDAARRTPPTLQPAGGFLRRRGTPSDASCPLVVGLHPNSSPEPADGTLETVPTTVSVRSLVDAEAAAVTSAEDAATELSDALSAVDADELAALRGLVDDASAALHALSLTDEPATWPEDWRTGALTAGLARREMGVWHQLAQVSGQARTAQDRLGQVGLRTVVLPRFEPVGEGSLGAQLAAGQALRAHLAAGNQLKRHFRPQVQKDAEPLLTGATVDGAPVANLVSLDYVMATLEAEHAAAALAGQWWGVGAAIDPQLSIRRRVAQLVDLATALDQILALVAARDQVERRLAAQGIRVPLATPGDWLGFVRALAAVEARLQAEQATEALAQLVERLALEARSPTAPPELGRLAEAAAARDADEYQGQLQRLAGAFGEQAEQRRCDELWARLQEAHPVVAELLARTAEDEEWDQRLTSFDGAWAWGRARTFFDRLREPGLEERLAVELRDAAERVERATAELAAEEAWGRCVLRMTAHQEQALRSYRASIEDRGKGTGRWAPRYAAAAREAMIEAREAVPAWIMPLGEIVETIPPDQNSFDVVIIDEASQASIESLFLLWLAPRVIVVGDDRQCAPSQVMRGELQPIFDRLDDYLSDLPEYLRLAFTPKSNLFGLLGTRFGSVVRLREHFRCMPEIIGWSSHQFYADAPLVPLRQFGADRLPPLRSVHVLGAVSEGESGRLHNPAEAEALVRQVVACVDDGAYADRTFGVVVLQGTAQVRMIEALLQARLAPAEWERRRLRVGTPPDFQGDQRDVIFLSMVVADRRRAVAARDWQRRFNVAASRARDQMWMFHSVGLDELSPADLRRSLLAYMLNPPSPVADASGRAHSSSRADGRVQRNGSAGSDDLDGWDGLSWESDTRMPFESQFEQRVFLTLRDRGYHVTPDVEVNGRRIDLVVTGAKGRLAVECDGDYWHRGGEDQLADIDRELELVRAGWQFWRVRESEFYLDPEAAVASLWVALAQRGIEPAVQSSASGVEPAGPGPPEWEAVPLSEEEGLEGVEDEGDGDEVSDLDIETGAWLPSSHHTGIRRPAPRRHVGGW